MFNSKTSCFHAGKEQKISRTQEKLLKLSRDGGGDDGDLSLVSFLNPLCL